VTAGNFREDLYYRIACLSVRLPALRERLDDIEVLGKDLLGPVAETMNQKFQLTPAAMDRLRLYDYPGNVRELRNILFIAATHAVAGKINEEIIEIVLQQVSRRMGQQGEGASVESPQAAAPPGKTNGSLQDVEAQHISQLLQQHNNNRRKVAQELGISERTLYRKLKRYHLGRPDRPRRAGDSSPADCRSGKGTQ
jgi:DNA-binding NtrC family response regulator